MSEKLLFQEEAAARLRCSTQTLYRWRQKGDGPQWFKIGPKRVAYSASDLERFLARTSPVPEKA